MSYYIQGNPNRAKEIKAAFEKLGYSTNGWNYNGKCGVYFTNEFDKTVDFTQNELFANLIKTHPDYQELELPGISKFKVGDWVVFNNNHNSIYQISEIKNFLYVLTHIHGGSMTLSFSQEELIRPWTIADAKDGDVLVSRSDNPFIYNGNIKFLSAGAYVGISRNGEIRLDMFPSKAWTSIKYVKPATSKQRNLLFKKIQEAGYQWYAGEKELHKIKPHYDISNFKPFDKVLVREANGRTWAIDFYGFVDEDNLFICSGYGYYPQCIPFEGNEHLLGTTDMCPEEYVNW